MLKYYNELLEKGAIKPDEAQALVAGRLDVLGTAIEAYAAPAGGLLGKLVGKKAVKPKGLFIWGKVGRGKSMLMDAFFKSLPVSEKKRAHFHEFMQEVHAAIHRFRSENADDPVVKVAREMADGVRILCFDEYEVSDVSDAMILSRLFREMSECGVVFVFTSNKRPEDHYKEGLQRQSYLEFCLYLAGQVEVVSLEAKKDYRLNRVTDEDNYFIPAGYEATQALKEKLKDIVAAPLKSMKINVQGREVALRASGRVAWAEFPDLCGKALGNADYIEIAREFDVLFLEGVPLMNEDYKDWARRFINLIDILYENKTLLFMTAGGEPEDLYKGGTAGFEFNRTVSRLKEMRGWKHRRENEERLD